LLILSGCGLFGPTNDARAPLVELTRPGPDAVLGGDVLVRLSAEARGEDNFVSFVNVAIDGERVGEAELVPLPNGEAGANPTFAFRFNSANFSDGVHTIQATAFDANQNRGLSNSVRVRFLNGVIDGVPNSQGPLAQITAPRDGEDVSGEVQIIVQPELGQPPITQVDFLIDGATVATTLTAPYTYNWNTLLEAEGLHVLQARVYTGPDVFRLTDPVAVDVIALDDPDEIENGCQTTGCVRFRRASFEGQVTGSVAIGFNNDLYVGSLNDTLYAFTPAGVLRWKRGTQGPIRTAPVVSNNENVFVASEDGRVYAFTPSGSLAWPPYVTGARLRSTPALSSDGFLYFGDDQGRLHAIDSFGGRPRTGFPIRVSLSAIEAPPVIARDRTVLVGSTDGSVYAYSPTGDPLWQSPNVGSITQPMALVERQVVQRLVTGTRTVTVNTLYAVTAQARVVALAGATGDVEWSADVTGPQRSGPIVGTDGAVYVGTSTGLAAFNETIDAGQSRLRFLLPGRDVGTPAIDANGVIYYVSGTVLRAANSNSTPVFTYELQTSVDAPLTIGRNGVLYLAGQNELLYALFTGSSGLASGKWPMFQRNSRHTGRIDVDSQDG
jgi:outer membrane protein assembly factor BamB